MGFNYGYEVKKFNSKWSVLHKEYESVGMSDADIEAMRDFDWEQLKSERRFQTHTQPLDGVVFADGDESGEDQSALHKRYLEELSVSQPEIREWSRRDWVEDLDTPELARYIKSLPEKDLDLLTAMVEDGMLRVDLSREMGVSRAAITKRITPIKKFTEKYL